MYFRSAVYDIIILFVESNDRFLADLRLFVSIIVDNLGEVFIYLIIVLNESSSSVV